MRSHVGQGATEYLVLLAVVLIVALVSVALLGFFPGMASDAQQTQSQTYWKSASPIAITELAAWGTQNAPAGRVIPYIRLRNTGAYPITVTKILGINSTNYITQAYLWNLNETNFSSYLTLAPGEETYLGYTNVNDSTYRHIQFYRSAGPSAGFGMYNIDSDCLPVQPYGTMVIKNFGFEYIERVDGQQITKREIGTAPLVAKCGPPIW